MSDSVETPVCDAENLNAVKAMSEVKDHVFDNVQGAAKGPSEILKISQSTIDKVNLNLSAWRATPKPLQPTRASEETVSEMEVGGTWSRGSSGIESGSTLEYPSTHREIWRIRERIRNIECGPRGPKYPGRYQRPFGTTLGLNKPRHC